MIKLIVSEEVTQELLALAGNSKSLTFPCAKTPKVIGALNSAPPYSGHDISCGLLPVLMNILLSKPLRCFLLFYYGQYLNISSASLMHLNLANKPLGEIESNFRYGISFTTNVRLLKRIYSDLSGVDICSPFKEELNTLLIEIRDFLLASNISVEPSPLNLTFKQPSICSPNTVSVFTYTPFYHLAFKNISLVILEQLLRYTSETLPISMTNVFKPCKITDTVHSFEVVLTEKQIFTIIEQREFHKMKDWGILCGQLKPLLK